MVAKSDGVVAGLPVAEMVFRKLDQNLTWNELTPDGSKVKKGDVLVEFEGTYRALLTGERTALNFCNVYRALQQCQPYMLMRLKIFRP